MESIFKTLKVERIYQTHYETRPQARLDNVDRIEGHYNQQRLHTSIDYITPVDYEFLRMTACVRMSRDEYDILGVVLHSEGSSLR